MSTQRIVRAGAAVVALPLLLTGCTGAQDPAVSSTSTGSSSPTTSAAPTPSITLETVQTFKLGKRRSGYLAVTPKAAFISVSPRGGDRPSRLMRLDLSTGKQSLVAGSNWSSGEIESVAASGNWVVWEDQSDSLSTGSPGGSFTVMWRVSAKNLKSGQEVLLDSSGTTASPDPPVLVTGGGYVGWAEYASDGSRTQMVWKVGKAHAQTVPVDLTSGPLQHAAPAKAIVDGRLIFARPADTKLGRKWGVGDCWSYPIDGKGKAQQLTHSGLVLGCWVSGGTDLVWTEQAAKPKNADPRALMTMPLDGTSEPRTIHEGHMSTRPLVGSGFALWFSGKPTNVSSLASTASTTFDGGDWVWQGAAGGQLVAYPSGGRRTTVTVLQVMESSS